LVIVRICEEFPPSAGGLAEGMAELSRAQHELGHTIIVITRAAPGNLKFDATLPFKVIRIETKKILTFGWKAYNVAKNLGIRPDIVHSHGPAGFSYLVRRSKKDPPLIHSMHAVRAYQYRLYNSYLKEHQISGYPSHLAYSFFSPYIIREYCIERFIARNADHLALVAGYFSKELERYYSIPSDKMTTVYNGSSFKSSSNKAISEGSKADTNRKVIFVGRFDWHKRIDLLIEAMGKLSARNSGSKLILVGDGEMKCVLEGLAKSFNLSDRVIFTGWMNQTAISEHYANASCFCLPSVSEGLPKVLLEAMSMDLPVIAADSLAAVELLRDGRYGFLVRRQTPDAWCDMIDLVLAGGREVLEKTEKAASLLNDMYRWRHVAERTDMIYRKVLEKKHIRSNA